MRRMTNQFEESVETKEGKPSKCARSLGFKDLKVKDILEILFALLIPTMIGILTAVLQKNDMEITQKNRENDLLIGELQRESDEQQTQAYANETVFSTYSKNMVDVMLRNFDDGTVQYNITRVLAITALRQLNLEKKRLVIQFLYDTQILKRGVYIFKIEERTEELKNLRGANLDNVNFGDDLDLSDIVLRSVSLVNASFANSDLRAADFSNSVLSGVSFLNTRLDNTRFVNAQLQRTDFRGATVKNIQLIQSNLTQSNITDEQISEALFIFNLILPNGTYARNKTFLVNGNAKQGTNGWNITSGEIQVRDSYFFGTSDAIMSQRINTTLGRIYGSYESFQYCISFLVHGSEGLTIGLGFLDQKLRVIDTDKITDITPNFCYNSSSNSLNFCYWSYCKDSISGTDYIDLQFIFQYDNNTANATTVTAVKDIEFTIITD